MTATEKRAGRTETHSWVVYEIARDEFITALGLDPKTDYISVSTIGRKVEIKTTLKGKR